VVIKLFFELTVIMPYAEFSQLFCLHFFLIEPIVNFSQSNYTVSESIGVLEIPLERKGDTNHVTTVYCTTRSGKQDQ